MAAKTKNKPSAYDFIVSELKRNKNAKFGDIKAKAQKKKLTISPVNYGRAQAALGIVKSSKRGEGKAKLKAKGRGRPKGSVGGGSKSDRIRELLAQGHGATDIAKRVGCTPGLVYNVKGKIGGKPANPRVGTRKAKSFRKGGDAMGQLMDGIRELQRERDDLKKALLGIQAVLSRVV